jgi:hypothetical protein
MCTVLVGKAEGKRPLRRKRHRWEDGIRMDLGETSWGGEFTWLKIVVAGCCECSDKPSGFGTTELV